MTTPSSSAVADNYAELIATWREAAVDEPAQHIAGASA